MTILTVNIWDLPFVTKDKKKRIQTLTVGLQRLSPDILCLQEAWEVSVRGRIFHALADYQITAQSLAPRLLMLDRTGGLVTAVKKRVEIEKSLFVPFQENGFFCLEDWLGKKGFFLTQVRFGGMNLTVVNTHLHVRMLGAHPHQRLVRTRQIQQILEGVAKEPNVILAGDFNIEPQSEEYEMMMKAGYRDATEGIGQSTNAYHAVYLNRFLVPRQRKVDYIFVKNTSVVTLQNPRLVFRDQLVSDHYGIMADITI